MPNLRQTCLEITVPSILILWWNRIGSWRNSGIVGGMHLSENLSNDEKTSRQKGFTALRLENKNRDPLFSVGQGLAHPPSAGPSTYIFLL